MQQPTQDPIPSIVLNAILETMDQEHHESSLITWVVVIGIILTLIMAAGAYIVANPESIARVFGRKVAAIKPVASANGATTNTARIQPAHTKHYANAFIEFDYPENFIITSELINKNKTQEGGTVDAFGHTEVILTATGTEGIYTLRIASVVNTDQSNAEQIIKNAKGDFFSQPNHGMNDSFQDITVIDRPGYKYFTEGHIRLGVPTEVLLYSADIIWDPTVGASTANTYLGIIEDSVVLK